MVGIPAKVVSRAGDILKQLESMRGGPDLNRKAIGSEKENMQLSFFQLDDPVLSQIKEEIIRTDINNLTPMEALNKLNEIKKILGG